MKIRTIVARWHEDVSWANSLKDEKIIYYKGHGLSHLTKYNQIEKINDELYHLAPHPFGNESHTFLMHICNHYPNFYDWECFVQGDPFFQCHNVVERINNLLSQPNIENGYTELNHYHDVVCRWRGDLVPGENDQTERTIDRNAKSHRYGQSKSMIEDFFPDIRIPDTTVMKPYGQFGVARENILRHPLSCYQSLLDTRYDPDKDSSNPHMVWLFEYGNHLIFDGKYYK